MHVKRTTQSFALIGFGAILGAGLTAGGGRTMSFAVPPEASARATDQEASAQAVTLRGWQRGKGWGWIWGKDDEIGALNGLTNESRASALASARRGEMLDLGMTYSRRSYKFPGHSPGEIITFRSPDGIHRMQDPDAPPADKNPDHVYWHSAALFISDNVATQIDGLAHITAGLDYHWYNGFRESDWGGDWGPAQV